MLERSRALQHIRPGYIRLMKGLKGIIARLSHGAANRSEAEIQADIRGFLLEAPFELDSTDLVVVTQDVVPTRRAESRAALWPREPCRLLKL